MHSFIKRGKMAWAVLFAIAFCCGVIFCVYTFGDFLLSHTIGRCNGGPTQVTCTMASDVNVCTCDQGYHFFWKQDPVTKKNQVK